MYEIDLTDQQHLIDLDRDRIDAVARDLLEVERVASASIGLVFVDDATIWRINREHLQHDYPTDVISFLSEVRQQDLSVEPGPDLPRGTGKVLEGEVIVSTETAHEQAQKYGWRTEEEVLLYIVHGMLHLAGYDDLTSNERKVMRHRERCILARWGLTPPQNDMDEEQPSDHSEKSTSSREGSS